MTENKHFSKSIEERKNEVKMIKEKYNDKVFIYLEKNKNCKNVKDIDKHKYLCPKEMLFSQFIYIVRKRLHISDKTSIVFFIKNIIPNPNNTMQELYEKNKDNDDFLYIKYTGENFFG
jgi:GABA(A) receptor-associated protein